MVVESEKDGVMASVTRTDAETEEYYDKQKKVYQEVWDDEGRICWGFFPDLETSTFKEAGLYHVERMCGVHNGKNHYQNIYKKISSSSPELHFRHNFQ